MAIYDNKDEIISLIDRGSWKHSWHLPKDRNGYVDWFSDETEKQVMKILIEDLDHANRLRQRLTAALKQINPAYINNQTNKKEELG